MADSEVFGGVASGAAQGAAVGATFGPIGAAVGGVLGGVAGLFGGKKRSKAKKYKRELLKYQRFVARKELLLESKRQQAEVSAAIVNTGAGTERSSGGFGVLGSVASQRASAIRQSEFGIKRQDKIKKLETKANQIEGFIGAASQLAPMAMDAYTKYKDQKPPKPSLSGNESLN